MSKVHIIRKPLPAMRAVVTYCGKVGWQAGSDEFDTSSNDRFEAIPKNRYRPAGELCRNCILAIPPHNGGENG